MLHQSVINRFMHETEGSSIGLGGAPFRFRFNAEDIKALGGAIAAGTGATLLALAPGEVTVSEELENYLPGYRPRGGYRADEISPIFLVDKDVGTYRYYGSANMYRLYHTETSYMAPVPKVDPETSTGQYAVVQHALGAIIPPNTERQANFDFRAASARKVADALALRREYEVLTRARATSSWASTNRITLTSDYYWNGGTLSNPLQDIQNGIMASMAEVTDIYLGHKAAYALLNHPLVRDYIKASNGDQGMAAQITNALRQPTYGGAPIDFQIPMLPPFHIAGGMINNSGTKEDIIGGDVIMTSNVGGSGEFDGIRTFQTFRARLDGGTGWITREFRIEDQGLQGVDALVAGYAEANVTIANDAGFLLKNVVSYP